MTRDDIINLACARIVEGQDVDPGFKHRIAAAIRARSNK